MSLRTCRSLAALLPALLLGSPLFAQPMRPPAPLVKVADIPLPGPAVRFDYQSYDATHGRLYISHMNAGHLIVFDTHTRRVLANLPGFSSVHGVLTVPAIHRVYASVTGEHKLAIVNMATLKTIATAGPINYPDGIAYAPTQRRVFVSDERGAEDAVVNAVTNTLITHIPLGGGAGNTVYDPTSGHILVAVHHLDQLAVIDPASLKIIARYPLHDIADPHGIALDPAAHLAFIAGEANHSLAVFNLRTHTLLSTHSTGDDPDVLAFDPGLQRLYVAAESGTVSIFQLHGHALTLIGQLLMPHAHTVAVDPQSHYVYFPLQDIHGHPVLRIMKPASLP
ncbi:MAG TPA: YncE family protein [Acidobacteriaceae bacterium]|nr:YncE family protein [Acidobacteriaceae bacterium]